MNEHSHEVSMNGLFQQAAEDYMSSKNTLKECLKNNQKEADCHTERLLYEIDGQAYHTLKGH